MALKKNPKFDLKLKYKRTLEICMVLSISFIVLAFKLFPTYQKAVVKKEEPQELIQIEDVQRTIHEKLPPPPPKPPIPIEAPTDELIDDVEIEDTELLVEEQITTPPPPPIEDEEEEVEPTFFIAVEQLPQPIGGMEGIHNRLVYPPIAQRAGVQGKVYVKAFVNELGKVERVELLKGIGAGCDEEVMRVVRETNFTPGKQRGKAVKVQVTLNIKFTLTHQ